MGLSAMEEREAAVGCKVDIEGRVGYGTNVAVACEEDGGRTADDEG